MPYANPFEAQRFKDMTENEREHHAAWQALALLEDVWNLRTYTEEDLDHLERVRRVAGDILNLAYPGFTDN